MARYWPSTWPGLRSPRLLLQDGQALFDEFGKGFTLLRLAPVEIAAWVDAADERGMPLKVVDVDEAKVRAICERKLILLRPDQHVPGAATNFPGIAGSLWIGFEAR